MIRVDFDFVCQLMQITSPVPTCFNSFALDSWFLRNRQLGEGHFCHPFASAWLPWHNLMRQLQLQTVSFDQVVAGPVLHISAPGTPCLQILRMSIAHASLSGH